METQTIRPTPTAHVHLIARSPHKVFEPAEATACCFPDPRSRSALEQPLVRNRFRNDDEAFGWANDFAYLDGDATIQAIACEGECRCSHPSATYLVTAAPEAYDGFGTATVAKLGVTNRRGEEYRLVELSNLSHIVWQTNRYASGLYGAVPEREFETWVRDGIA